MVEFPITYDVAGILRDPHILDIIKSNMDQHVVGEDENKLLLFLAGVSAKSKIPLSVRVVGESSVGKTWLATQSLRYIPPNMVMVYTGVSAKALWHLPEEKKDLTNKVLVILEEAGAEASYASIRPILSRDQPEFTYAVTEKNKETGRFETNEITLKGTPAFITTTARANILPETGTRVLEVNPDRSEEQTRRILEHRKAVAADGIVEERDLPLMSVVRAAIDSLNPGMRVIIPYAKHIVFPAGQLRARRDIDKLLSVIRASAILHQYQRCILERGEDSFIITGLQDFSIAMRICFPSLGPTLAGVSRYTLETFRLVEDLFEEPGTDSITIRNLSTEGPSYSQAREHLEALVAAGYMMKEKVGGVNRYYLKKKPAQVLPTDFETLQVSFSQKELENWLKGNCLSVAGSIKGPPEKGISDLSRPTLTLEAFIAEYFKGFPIPPATDKHLPLEPELSPSAGKKPAQVSVSAGETSAGSLPDRFEAPMKAVGNLGDLVIAHLGAKAGEDHKIRMTFAPRWMLRQATSRGFRR